MVPTMNHLLFVAVSLASLASAKPVDPPVCPTITSTVPAPSCWPSFNKSCITPACILLTTITLPCGCGNGAAPTVYSTAGCACPTGCATATETVHPPCPWPTGWPTGIFPTGVWPTGGWPTIWPTSYPTSGPGHHPGHGPGHPGHEGPGHHQGHGPGHPDHPEHGRPKREDKPQHWFLG
ncbi:hypothetical protein Sste5346_006842 [Sporothrix stenoceras]|uniref:Uncharacterized protein n=1 Tax=Sporothrix stenoceras TaxID=5173 RepID=A0ABR3YZM4_9PEZI